MMDSLAKGNRKVLKAYWYKRATEQLPMTGLKLWRNDQLKSSIQKCIRFSPEMFDELITR